METDKGPTEARGALATIAEDHSSRKRFLRMAGTGAGAVALLAAGCAGGGDDGGDGAGTSSGGKSAGGEGTPAAGTAPAVAQTDANDQEIVAFALLLEQLEADFYRKVEEADLFSGDQLELVKTFGAHEQEHVRALTRTLKQLGGTVPKAPATKFDLERPERVLRLAAKFENVGASAYLGQAPNIKDEEILAAALGIHAVEARHAATLNSLLGRPATPDGAFALPMAMNEVLPLVQPFIVG